MTGKTNNNKRSARCCCCCCCWWCPSLCSPVSVCLSVCLRPPKARIAQLRPVFALLLLEPQLQLERLLPLLHWSRQVRRRSTEHSSARLGKQKATSTHCQCCARRPAGVCAPQTRSSFGGGKVEKESWLCELLLIARCSLLSTWSSSSSSTSTKCQQQQQHIAASRRFATKAIALFSCESVRPSVSQSTRHER